MNKSFRKSLCVSAVLGLFVGNVPNRDVSAMESYQNIDQQNQNSNMAIRGPLNVLVIGEKGVGKSAIANYMRQNLKGEFPVNKSPVQHGKVFQAQNNPRCKIVEIDVDELLNNELGIDAKFLVDNANLVFYVMDERTANFETYKKFYNGFNRIWINDPNFEFCPYGDGIANFWNNKLMELGKKHGIKHAQPRYMFNIFNGDKEKNANFEKYLYDRDNLDFHNFVSKLPDGRNINQEDLSVKFNLDEYCEYIMGAKETLINVNVTDSYNFENLKLENKQKKNDNQVPMLITMFLALVGVGGSFALYSKKSKNAKDTEVHEDFNRMEHNN